MNRPASKPLAAAPAVVLACLAGLGVTASLQAQVPDNTFVFSRCQEASTTASAGGLSWISAAAPAVPTPVQGLPGELTGTSSGVGVEGAGSVLVDPRTGNLIVGEHTLPGATADIHVLPLSGSRVIAGAATKYPLGAKPKGIGSVDQMAWLGEDIVFAVRGNKMTSGIMAGHLLGMFRPRLGPPGTPGTVVPIPLTTLPAATINSLAVDAQNGFAYFSRNRAQSGSDIYRVPVPGDGVTPATPVLVATIPGGILNLVVDGAGMLLVGCGTNWGAGVPLYRVDVSQSNAVVTPVRLPVGNVNAMTVDNVTGEVLIADSWSNMLFRVRADGTLRQVGLSRGGFVTGLAYRQPLETYGPPPASGAQQHVWQLGPNAGGAPKTGNAQFSLSLHSSPGQSIGLVGVGFVEAPLELLGMRVLIDPASMFTLPISLPSSGSTTIPLPIPANQGLVGKSVVLQSFHTGPNGWSASRGLRITMLP